jgi:hypothetical protein
MDVNSAFLNDSIKEEVYVEQPLDFKSEKYPNYVYKLYKTLYGLKQAPRAWYEYLTDFLIENDFKIGKGDSTLFTKRMSKDLFVCQIYIDGIIFGSTNKSFYDEFSKIMTDMPEMSMMRVLTFFLRFQIKQVKDETFISQIKYTCDILKKFSMDKTKSIKTHIGTNGHLDLDMGGTSVDQKVYRYMIRYFLYICASKPDIMLSLCMCVGFQTALKDYHLRVVKRIMRYLVLTHNLGLWYPNGSHFELLGYSDVDYVRCKVYRKSTSRTCQFLGRSLSTAEAEYVTAGSYCAQLLWIRQTLNDYSYTMNNVPLLCDNKSVINITYNSCEHSKTKHIDILHHFLRDHAIKGDIGISHVGTNDQLANIFTKLLDE